MKLSKDPCRGMRDFFPHIQRRWEYLAHEMKAVAESFGHEPYDGPLLEELDLYKAKSGEEMINGQVYSFEDRGGRQVAIRPEMTPTLARMVSQVYKEYPKPLRWYSIPSIMRYERPQRGRLREHRQFNVDIFGALEGRGELEVIQLVQSFFERLGASERHFKIFVNDRKIVEFVFKKQMKCNDKLFRELCKIVDKATKVSREKLDGMIKELSLSHANLSFFNSYLKLNGFDELHDFLDSVGATEVGERLFSFVKEAQEIGLDKYIVFGPHIVRGLEYYTGIVFEIFDKNPQNARAICGGGAYANLLEIFGEGSLPGVGFGLGDVTLIDFLEGHGLLKDFSLPDNNILIAFQDETDRMKAIKWAQELRGKGLKVISQLEQTKKVKKAFETAEKKGVRYVAFVGQDESDKSIKDRTPDKPQPWYHRLISNYIKQ